MKLAEWSRVTLVHRAFDLPFVVLEEIATIPSKRSTARFRDVGTSGIAT
ncbi:hypothetical protein [Halorubellus litoreus]|uniref:Uncharacterized protein n=1 Tax=Halorubellus litoreus TaxID=755308 RepID=A0ABD5VMT8_9EURY